MPSENAYAENLPHKFINYIAPFEPSGTIIGWLQLIKLQGLYEYTKKFPGNSNVRGW
jgi:hypothetical protein